MRAAIPSGILGGFPYSCYIMFGLFLADSAIIATGQALQFAYRISVTYDDSHWMRKLLATKLSRLYFSMFSLLLVLSSLCLVPVVTNIIDPLQAQQMFVADFPALQALVDQYPSLTGYHPELTNSIFDFILYYGTAFCPALPLISIISLTLFARRLQRLKRNSILKTHSIHVMLWKALCAQCACFTIFLISPLTVFVYCLYFEVIWGSYVATLSIFVNSFHIIACSLCILWFITPYRNYVKDCLHNICGKKGKTLTVASSQNQYGLS
uniref:G protein-coupled receptor n=2 Tax=Panagrellus redivivus TaxID=6233 RepID=A0A7E5A0M9_PANRE